MEIGIQRLDPKQPEACPYCPADAESVVEEAVEDISKCKQLRYYECGECGRRWHEYWFRSTALDSWEFKWWAIPVIET